MADTLALIKATFDTATGTVRGTLDPQPVDRRITTMVIKGPARSTFALYAGLAAIDSNQLSRTPTGGGGDNTYDSTTDGAPVLIPAGVQCIGVWSGGATAAGQTGTATVRATY